jgi:hypothetical protein
LMSITQSEVSNCSEAVIPDTRLKRIALYIAQVDDKPVLYWHTGTQYTKPDMLASSTQIYNPRFSNYLGRYLRYHQKRNH